MKSSRSLHSPSATLRPQRLFVLALLSLPFMLFAQDTAELDALLQRIPTGTRYDTIEVTRAFDARVSRDPQNAIRLLLKAANLGDSGAQTSLGYLYARGDVVPRDDEQAFRWFQRAATDNYAPEQFDLGMLLLQPGIHHDEQAGVRWLTRAAQQGLVPAQTNLGVLCLTGTFVKHDERQALHWLRQAAKQHFVHAEFLIGMAYERGSGVKKDFAEAARWYRKAAEQGYAPAQNNLAGLYRNGAGVAKNIKEAIIWYRSAAAQGESTSYSNLMRLYSDGHDMEPDYSEAYRWALLALSNPSPFSNTVSADFVEVLRSRISREQGKRIEMEVANWIAHHPAIPSDYMLPSLSSALLSSSK